MLGIDEIIRGAGVTLPIARGSFGIVEDLEENSRLEIYEADLVEEAKEEDGKDSTKYQPEGLRELNLIINGITIHNDKYQHSQGTEMG